MLTELSVVEQRYLAVREATPDPTNALLEATINGLCALHAAAAS